MASEGLQDGADDAVGDVVGHALDGGAAFVEIDFGVGSHFVALAKFVVLVRVKHLAGFAVGERDLQGDDHLGAGGAAGGGVGGGAHGVEVGQGAGEDCVGLGGIGDDGVAGAGVELAGDFGGKQARQCVAHGGIAEGGNGDGVDGVGDERGAAADVIAAVGRQEHGG